MECDVMTQAEFGNLVGISQPAVSSLMKGGVIDPGDPWRVWLLDYCARLREQAAGRLSSDGGGLDLVQERAALARVQRERVELANAVTRGEFAPIDLLGDALSKAITIMVAELEQIDGLISQTAPDLPEPTRRAVLNAVASARNKIASRGASLVMADLDPADDIDLDDTAVSAD